MNLFTYIKYKLLELKWDKILKDSKCRTWENYFRKNDLDFSTMQTTIRSMYSGYPYVALVSNIPMVDYGMNGVWKSLEVVSNIDAWCGKHCVGKFRIQYESVIKVNDEWTLNGIGGTDEVFVGFKNEQDSVLFKLVWA